MPLPRLQILIGVGGRGARIGDGIAAVACGLAISRPHANAIRFIRELNG